MIEPISTVLFSYSWRGKYIKSETQGPGRSGNHNYMFGNCLIHLSLSVCNKIVPYLFNILWLGQLRLTPIVTLLLKQTNTLD